MRILWIGKNPAAGAAGDEVFDRKTIAALRQRGDEVGTLLVDRVGRLRECFNIVRGLPHNRARYDRPSHRSLAIEAARSHDLTICSWEPLDVLALGLPGPSVLIAHNITSSALPSMFPQSLLARAAARRAQRWERLHYRRTQCSAIAVLSARDQDLIRQLPDAPAIIRLTPGMPPSIPLSETARFAAELVVSGTYDWRPKRRDLELFDREYGALPERLPIWADGWPPDLASHLGTRSSLSDDACCVAIRLGLVTDRFVSGHKLKTLAHIARNQIVLSFTDVAHDFGDIPDSAYFLRTIGSVSEIGRAAAEFSAVSPQILHARFNEFKDACLARFTWAAVADALAATHCNRPV